MKLDQLIHEAKALTTEPERKQAVIEIDGKQYQIKETECFINDFIIRCKDERQAR